MADEKLLEVLQVVKFILKERDALVLNSLKEIIHSRIGLVDVREQFIGLNEKEAERDG